MMQRMVFPVAQTTTNNQTRIVWFGALFVFVLFAVVFTIFAISDPFFWLVEGWGVAIFAAVSAAVTAVAVIGMRMSINWLQRLRLALTAHGIERRTSKTTEEISYAAVQSVLIFEGREGKVGTIQIKSAESTFLLQGFEQMEQLATELVERLPDKTVVERKPVLFANYNPQTILLGATIGMLVLVFIVFISRSSELLLVLLQLAVFGSQGVLFITGRPISRIYGQKWQYWERALGVVILILVVALAGLQLMAKGTAVLGISPCGWYGKYVQQSGCVNSFENGEYVAFTADSQNLVYDSFKHIIIAPIDGRTWAWTPYLSHDDFILDFMLSQDGKTLISATFSGQREFWVWDVPTRALVQEGTFTLPVSTHNLALSPDGQKMAISSSNIELWHTATWQNSLTIEGNGAMAFSPDGSLLAGRWEDDLVLWDTQDGHEVQSFNLSDGYSHLVNLTFSPDGTQLAAGEFLAGKIAVWEVANGRLLYDWDEGLNWQVEGLAFATNGRLLAASYSNQFTGENHIKFWSLADGSLVKQIELSTGVLYQVESLAFSPDGRWFATGSNEGAMVFDMAQIVR